MALKFKSILLLFIGLLAIYSFMVRCQLEIPEESIKILKYS